MFAFGTLHTFPFCLCLFICLAHFSSCHILWLTYEMCRFTSITHMCALFVFVARQSSGAEWTQANSTKWTNERIFHLFDQEEGKKNNTINKRTYAYIIKAQKKINQNNTENKWAFYELMRFCTIFTWMTLNTLKSVFVKSWRKFAITKITKTI